MDPNMTLPSNTMWGGGGLDRLVMPMVAILISLAMMYMLRELVKGGVTKLVTPPATPETATEEVAATPEAPTEVPESDGRATPFDGFDPAMYGPPPEEPPGGTAAEELTGAHPTT